MTNKSDIKTSQLCALLALLVEAGKELATEKDPNDDVALYDFVPEVHIIKNTRTASSAEALLPGEFNALKTASKLRALEASLEMRLLCCS